MTAPYTLTDLKQNQFGCIWCGAKWGGTRAEHCRVEGCHQTFSGSGAGDMHRVGSGANRRCLSVEEMEAKGMTVGKRGLWTTGQDMPEAWTKDEDD